MLLRGQNLWPWLCDCKSLALALEGRPQHKSRRSLIWLMSVFFPAKRNEFPVVVTSEISWISNPHTQKFRFYLYIKSFNDGKKLHTYECYVGVISFIPSVLALTLTLTLMPWPWSWWCCLVNITELRLAIGLRSGLRIVRPLGKVWFRAGYWVSDL